MYYTLADREEELKKKKEREKYFYKRELDTNLALTFRTGKRKAKIKSSAPKRKIQKVHPFAEGIILQLFNRKLFNILSRHEKNVSREFVTARIY